MRAMLDSQRPRTSTTAAATSCATSLSTCRRRAAYVPDRPQRRRQDDAAEDASWACCRRARRAMRFDGRDDPDAQPAEIARARSASATCRRAARSSPQLTRRGEPADGAGAHKDGAREIPSDIFELFPVLKQMLQPPRRRSLGRPAAAARHRRALAAEPEAADPRRADRGHPAQHRARDRRRDPEAAQRAQHDGVARGAEAAVRAPARAAFLHPRARPRRRQRQDGGSRRASWSTATSRCEAAPSFGTRLWSAFRAIEGDDEQHL